MVEEFHGDSNGSTRLFYGWGTLNTNVWLPSVSELVGVTGTEHPTVGTYFSAMQGLNLTSLHQNVDAQGGAQFSYFQQYNAAGGQKVWFCGGSHQFWTRSSKCVESTSVWMMRDMAYFHTPYVVNTHAIHPAVGWNSGDKKERVAPFCLQRIIIAAPWRPRRRVCRFL